MEADIVKTVTSDKIECLICFICNDGYKELIKEEYIKKSEKFVIGKSRNVYWIDVRLAQMLSQISNKNVLGCGASVCINVESMNGGGVVGDPFSQSESAGDGMERQENGLWCIAYSGRLGCVFEADNDIAQDIYEKIDMQSKDDLKAAVSVMEEVLLSKSNTFIVASDGCGEGALRYVSAGKNKNIKRLE